MYRIKIKQSEKSLSKKNKITIKSPLILTKQDFIFIFNKKIKKINKLRKGNTYFTIITFWKNIYNNNIYKIDI